MSETISVQGFSSHPATLIDHQPDVCPVCHHAIVAIRTIATANGEANAIGTLIDIAFQCTKLECRRLFISTYKREKSGRDSAGRTISTGDFKFQKSVPLTHKRPILSKEVISVSPAFESIYGQACTAEADGLDEIAGVGYRKSLEFLIKDYCISVKPDSAEEIKAGFLAKVIDTYIDDANIKACAKLAAWL